MKFALRFIYVVMFLSLSVSVYSQNLWPSKLVRIISTSPPGGSVDIFARILAEEFSKSLGQPFVVESRPGANGNIGVDLVLKAPADGHMLFVAPAGPFSINASIMESMPFNAKKDILPVAMLGVSPLVLVVHPSVPANDLKQLLIWMKQQDGKVNYASQAIASTGYLAMELLKLQTGVEATHIPYKGSAAAATTDLLAGRVSMSFLNKSAVLPHWRSGQLRAIGVAEPKRIMAAPDIPTIAESGLTGFEATSWFGLGARSGTPQDIVNRLSKIAANALARPDVVARLSKIGIEPRFLGSDQFVDFVHAESLKWEDIVRRTGAKAD